MSLAEVDNSEEFLLPFAKEEVGMGYSFVYPEHSVKLCFLLALFHAPLVPHLPDTPLPDFG